MEAPSTECNFTVAGVSGLVVEQRTRKCLCRPESYSGHLQATLSKLPTYSVLSLLPSPDVKWVVAYRLRGEGLEALASKTLALALS